MATFSDLPNELVIAIWGYVLEPEDVESFALVSKGVNGLATPFVREHRRLKREYSEIRLLNDGTGFKPADLLEKMLRNPRIALYIKELQIIGWADCWEEQIFRDDTSYSMETMNLFEDTIRHSSLTSHTTIEDWIEEIKIGSEEPILALMIMQTTKLENLGLIRYRSVADHYLLRTLEQMTHSTEARQLSTFSNLSDLTILDCDITIDALSRMLRSIKDLKSFRYHGGVNSPIEDFEIRSKLFQSSQHSLHKLSFKKIDEEPVPMREFTRFEALTELEMDAFLLLSNKEKACRVLADVLPMSIEKVTLFWYCSASFGVLQEVVSEMVKSKEKRLPYLKELTAGFVDTDISFHTERISELEAKSAGVGVLFRVKTFRKEEYVFER